MADIAKGSAIPTTYLPEGWAKKAAEHFNCSENKIERVVYGLASPTKSNLAIFDYMLAMAENGKVEHEKSEQDRLQRLKALSA